MHSASKKPYPLPLSRYTVVDVTGPGQFELVFDDPERSRLTLEGAFALHVGDQIDEYVPPCADWVRDLLMSLISVPVQSARYDLRGNLEIVFADARKLVVVDGPFESWHYSNAAGTTLHGGVGRVVRFEGRRPVR